MEGTKRLALAFIASITTINQSRDVVALDGRRCAAAFAFRIRFANWVPAKEPWPEAVDVVRAIAAGLAGSARRWLVSVLGASGP
jgi:hypothetical protein